MKNKRIFFIELTWTGHHQSYAEKFAVWTIQNGYEPVFIGPANRIPDDFQYKTIALDEKIINDIISLPDWLKRFWIWLSLFRFFLKSNIGVNDLVFFLYWDDWRNFAPSFKLFKKYFPFYFGALWMNSFMFSIIKDKWLGGTNQFYILSESDIEKNLLAKHAKLLPDPPSNSIKDINFDLDIIKSIASKKENKKIVLLIGLLSPRKGLDYWEKVNRLEGGENWLWVVAGIWEANPQMLSQWKTNNSMLVLDRKLNDLEFNSLINFCDLVYAVYPGWQGSSGILSFASLAKKPIVVAKNTLMEKRVKNYEIGWSVDYDRPESFLLILKNIEKSSIKFSFQDFNSNFTWKNFYSQLSCWLSSIPIIKAELKYSKYYLIKLIVDLYKSLKKILVKIK